MYWLGGAGSEQNLSMSCMRCIIYHVRSLKLFNGLCSHYPVSVFSCVFWEFPLMEGQIDSYEIVITAFLSNEHNHQIVTEDAVNLGWHWAVSTIRTWARGRRESGPIRQCQITQQACPSFVSTVVLLPVSICFLSLPWLMGPLEELSIMSGVARRWFLCQS